MSTIGFAITARGAARTVAVLGAAGLLAVLAGSGAWLVPIQRRLVASGSEHSSPELETMRTQWLRGHLVRSAVALTAPILIVVAALS